MTDKYAGLHCVLVDEKDDTFLCKASIKRFNTSYEWWYAACPTCAKQMYKDPTTAQQMCQKHINQMPTPWYKVFLVLEDETNEINALIIGKLGEKVFGMPCKDLVYNQRSTDHKQLPMSSTTVSSSTTPAEKTGETHKRKRDSIRRALFTEAKNRQRKSLMQMSRILVRFQSNC
ncbi:uncharacterized protein LOC126612445 isoform X3 [Malus sylvestris]|uniref:uncharacterized protein LOC126612445 isoform X3 n=1 Tax=Malus sylvestris TaxID=3752 RepID=UPI0021ABF81E|nr:uncharacterized protein LOC126612445 isoform X3 [Malus sylvestris]